MLKKLLQWVGLIKKNRYLTNCPLAIKDACGVKHVLFSNMRDFIYFVAKHYNADCPIQCIEENFPEFKFPNELILPFIDLWETVKTDLPAPQK